MHNKLLEILELIKEKDVVYEDIYVTQFGRILLIGTRVTDLNIKTFNSDYRYGFTIAIIQKEYEDLKKVLGCRYAIHPHRPNAELLEAVRAYCINYINIPS